MRLQLARRPNRLDAKHPIIIDELLDLAQDGKKEAISVMIKMMADLHERGRESRYLKPLTGLPVWELKPTSRGGVKGGSRVYLFITDDNMAGIVNCEIKDGTTASTQKLKVVLEIISAYKADIPIFATA